MKTILVTGGAGFIGSNFINLITELSSKYKSNCTYNIINLDKLSYAANLNNLSPTLIIKNKNSNSNYNYNYNYNHNSNSNSNYNGTNNTGYYKFYKGNICDTKLVNFILEKHNPDIIINFAAESHVDRSISNPQDFIQTNIFGTYNLLNCAKKNWEPCNYFNKLFFQISTDEVYGSLLEDDFSTRFIETTSLAPHSPYAASKASADLIVQSYFDTYGFPVIISRCSNNYGPRQFPEKLIPLVITQAAKNLPIPVYGDGKNIRDWIYVEEHCKAILELIANGRKGEVYNIGASCEIKNIDLIKKILNIMKKPHSLIEYVADRLGHDRRYGVDASKIFKEFNFKAENNLENNLIKTIDWYLQEYL